MSIGRKSNINAIGRANIQGKIPQSSRIIGALGRGMFSQPHFWKLNPKRIDVSVS